MSTSPTNCTPKLHELLIDILSRLRIIKKPNFFTFLPSEIIIDILSRLPVRTIVTCRCVCRSWRDLLQTRDFAHFHRSRSSVPTLVIGTISHPLYIKYLNELILFEFDEVLGLHHDHDDRYKPLTRIDSMECIDSSILMGSGDGILLLWRLVDYHALYICNPITRELMEIRYDYVFGSSNTFGFGVSKLTCQHKVVRLFYCARRNNVIVSECLVYTLGTGRWRSIIPQFRFEYDPKSIGIYLNGNLHWLAKVFVGSRCISCFDLETETFSTFSLPSLLCESFDDVGLVVLEDCLCVCETTSEGEIVIWLMKEYGDEKSWTKEFVIKMPDNVLNRVPKVVHPIKVFKDGDILMDWLNRVMIYYSNKTKNTKPSRVGHLPQLDTDIMRAMLHTSSFVSLSSFGSEAVLILCI